MRFDATLKMEGIVIIKWKIDKGKEYEEANKVANSKTISLKNFYFYKRKLISFTQISISFLTKQKQCS